MSDLMRHCHGCGYYAPMQRWCVVGSAPERCSRCDPNPLMERLARSEQLIAIKDQKIAALESEGERVRGVSAKEGGDDGSM